MLSFSSDSLKLILFKNLTKFFVTCKMMTHSKLKERILLFNVEVSKCSCGQTVEYGSKRDWEMNVWLHRKVCSSLPEGSKQVKKTKKSITLKEQQKNEAQRMQRVHDYY